MQESSVGSYGSASTSLLQQARAGLPDAWQRIVRIYEPVVYRWCRRAGVAEHDAADLTQEVFQSVTTHLAGFRRDRPSDSFRGWLWTITRNKVLDHFRRREGRPDAIGGSTFQQRLATIPELGDDSSSSVCEPQDDRRLLIQSVLNQLRQEIEGKTWTVFWRTTIDGDPANDVARDLGMTTKAVRQAKYRVLQRLRQELAGLEEEL